TTTEEVNQMSKEIAGLNEKIQMVEAQGAPANDERDRRDLLLKKLGDKVDISYAEGSDGHVSVTAGRTAVLVAGTSSNNIKAARTGDRSRVEIFFQNSPTGTPANITDQLQGGRIGGALEVRDKVVEDLLGSIDTMAYSFAKEVNSAHIEGFDRNGKNGVLFFDMPQEVKGAAESLTVNRTIYNDVSKIAAGAQPNAPGDNTVANVISSLQGRGTMDNGSATFDDFYSNQVGQIGTLAQRAVKSQEAQKGVVDQLQNIRESVSGVSLDEETTKMIEFQKSFEASARIIKVADEMFDTILNLKRM
ncbi:MAG: flagellar hook-associated protein FlgK, partial [Proteobacteria bacterium]